VTTSAFRGLIAFVRARIAPRRVTRRDAPRFPLAAVVRLGEVVAGERLPGGAGGVEFVRLGTVAACRPLRPIDLDHPLALLEQIGGETRAEAARALDRADSPPRCPLCRSAPGFRDEVVAVPVMLPGRTLGRA
jgi:hypothetical protein